MFRFFFYMLLIGSLFPFTIAAQEGALLPVKQNGKWGYIDETGRLAIAPTFEYAGDFSDSAFALTIKGGKVGVINRNGLAVIPHIYTDIAFLSSGCYAVLQDSGWGIANNGGHLIYPCQADRIDYLWPAHFLIEQAGRYGLANYAGKMVIPAMYDTIQQPMEGFYEVKANNMLGLIDSMGKTILKPCYTDILYPSEDNPELLFFSHGKKWGFSTLDETYFSDTLWNTYKCLGADFLYCQGDSSTKLFSFSTGKTREDSLSSELDVLSRNYLKFQWQGKYGIIDSTCAIVLKPIYNDIELISDHLFSVQQNNKWAITNSREKIKTPLAYDNVMPYYSFFSLVTKNGLWGLVDKTPKEVAKPIYKKIDQLDNLFKLYDKNNTLSILHYDSKGTITDNETYTNVQTIHIGKDRSSIKGRTLFSTNRLDSISTMYNKFGWYQDSTNRKWGLKDSCGQWLIKPSFRNIYVYDSLNLTLVELHTPDKYFLISGYEIIYNTLYGLVNHTTKKILMQPVYLGIEMSEFKPQTNYVARFVQTDGTWGIVNPKGKILMDRLPYIGSFSCGFARINEDGRIGRYMGTNELLDNINHFVREMPGDAYYSGSKRQENISCNRGTWSYISREGIRQVYDSVSKFDFARDYVNNTAIAKKEGKYGLLSTKKIVLTFDYMHIDYIKNTGNKLLALEKSLARYGFIKKSGQLISPIQYQNVRDFKNAYAAICKGGKWGFIDTLGKEICTPQYAKVNDFCGGMAAVFRKGKWGFINESGEEVVSCIYKSVGTFNENVCPVNSNNQWGYINQQGKTIIDHQFVSAAGFQRGYAVVGTKQGEGLINHAGKTIIPPKYKSLEPVDRYGYLIAKDDKGTGVIDTNNKKQVPFVYSSIKPFENGYAIIANNSTQGFIDSTGNIIAEPAYHKAHNFSEGYALVLDKNKWVYINNKGKASFNYEYTTATDFINGYALVSIKNKYMLLNRAGEHSLISDKLRVLSYSAEGYSLISKGKKVYFANREGKNFMDKQFDNAHNFTDGMALVCNKGKWGIINHYGMYQLSCKYEWIKDFSEGLAAVRENKLYGICDTAGKFIIEPVYDLIECIHGNFFRVESDDKIGYFTLNGKWLRKPTD